MSDHKEHWFTSHSQKMTVKVYGDHAKIFDDSKQDRSGITVRKVDGLWQVPKGDRGKVALHMIKWVENKTMDHDRSI